MFWVTLIISVWMLVFDIFNDDENYSSYHGDIMTRFVNPFGQYFDDAGNPLISGQLRFLDSGTNTLANTYSDINLATPNVNPLPLTASGRLPSCFLANKYYKVRLETSAGVLIEERDPVGGFSCRHVARKFGSAS